MKEKPLKINYLYQQQQKTDKEPKITKNMYFDSVIILQFNDRNYA